MDEEPKSLFILLFKLSEYSNCTVIYGEYIFKIYKIIFYT